MAYNKPGDFFLGVIEFFGILVPGAVLLFLQSDVAVSVLGESFQSGELSKVQEEFSKLSLGAQWIAFLIGSFLLGHLLLTAGVPLGRFREWYLHKWYSKDHLYEWMGNHIDFPEEQPDQPDNPRWQDRRHIFNRALSFIRLKSESAMAELERQLAAYKLFRSLTMVFLLDLFIALIGSTAPGTRFLISGLLALICFVLFWIRQTWAEELAFEYYLLIKTSIKHKVTYPFL